MQLNIQLIITNKLTKISVLLKTYLTNGKIIKIICIQIKNKFNKNKMQNNL